MLGLGSRVFESTALTRTCAYKGEDFRSPPYISARRVASIPPTHPAYSLLGFRVPKQMSFPPSPLEQKGELKRTRVTAEDLGSSLRELKPCELITPCVVVAVGWQQRTLLSLCQRVTPCVVVAVGWQQRTLLSQCLRVTPCVVVA